jgi:phosphoglycolate phosphatase
VKYSSFLFDLDGTLADSCAGIEWSAHRALAEVAPEAPRRSIRPFIGPPIRDIFESYLRQYAPPRATDAAQLDALTRRYRHHYDGGGCRRVTAFSGANETLAGLKARGARLFVVTNKPAAATARVLDALELNSFLEAALSPDSVAPHFAGKSEATRYALREYSISPAAALFVGDARDDARAAHENGLDFAAVRHGYGGAHLSGEFPVRYTLAHLSELLQWV